MKRGSGGGGGGLCGTMHAKASSLICGRPLSFDVLVRAVCLRAQIWAVFVLVIALLLLLFEAHLPVVPACSDA